MIRHGAGGGDGRQEDCWATLREVAERLGISNQRVSQIEIVAIRKLRWPPDQRKGRRVT